MITTNVNESALRAFARQTSEVALRAQELLRTVEEVSQYSAKVAARTAARRRVRELRDLARDIERCAATVERLRLNRRWIDCASKPRATRVSRAASTSRCATGERQPRRRDHTALLAAMYANAYANRSV